MAEVSFTVHKIFASINDDQERFETILNPPQGTSRWTPDEAKRRTGRQRLLRRDATVVRTETGP